MAVTYMDKEWRNYKPQKDGNGAASTVQVKVVQEDKRRDVQVFWVATLQNGVDENQNAKFGWKEPEKSVTIKLGETDIGELLAVLNGVKQFIGAKDKGLYHQNEKGNTSFSFELAEYKGIARYSLRLAKKVGDQLTQVKHSVSLGEGQILKVLLEDVVKLIYQWKYDPPTT